MTDIVLPNLSEDRDEQKARVAGSKGSKKLYFKWILKAWVGKLSRKLERPPGLCMSVVLPQAGKRSAKIVYIRRNFSVEFSLATYRIRSVGEFVKVRMLQDSTS